MTRGPRRAAPLLLSVVLHAGAGALLVVEPLLALPRAPEPPEGPIVYRQSVDLAAASRGERTRTGGSEGAKGPRPAALAPTAPVARAPVPAPLSIPETPAGATDVALAEEAFFTGEGTGSDPVATGDGRGDGTGDGNGDGSGAGEGSGEEILPIGPRVTPPVLVHGPAPDYPETARRVGLEGTVVLEAVIGPDGSVRDARLVRGANPLLDAAAARAVLGWRYLPARVGARPVAVYLAVTVRFAIQR
ncbi:MAG: energy transducer TonB [Acidobacteria bacterium]|nr:MAG: energy transducer TonB [Acidobacteriota bacterium]